jgi:hypothetical protein
MCVYITPVSEPSSSLRRSSAVHVLGDEHLLGGELVLVVSTFHRYSVRWQRVGPG